MAQKLNTDVSIVDYLKSTGQDSSMAARKVIAKQLGIKNYTGTAAQNTQMLQTLKAQDTKATTTTTTTQPAKPATTTTTTQPAKTTGTKPSKNADKAAGISGAPLSINTPNLADEYMKSINALFPDGVENRYTFDPIQQIAAVMPQLRSAAELAQMYGLDYDYDKIYNTLMKSVDDAYKVRYHDQEVAEGKYYDNAATAQSTLADTLAQQQSQAIQTGTNRGMVASQALSSMLGVSQQFGENATRLAQDRGKLSKEYGASKSATGEKALGMYNEMGMYLGDLAKNLYSSDMSGYAAQLDYNASVNTANSTMSAASMGAQAQLESTLSNSLANIYNNHYNGLISLEQAKIAAEAEVKAAKVYGADAATINGAANQAIAKIGADAQVSSAQIASQGNVAAAQASAQGYIDAAKINSTAQNNSAAGSAVAGLLEAVNQGLYSKGEANKILNDMYNAGVITENWYNSYAGLFTSDTPTNPLVPGATAPSGGTTGANAGGYTGGTTPGGLTHSSSSGSFGTPTNVWSDFKDMLAQWGIK